MSWYVGISIIVLNVLFLLGAVIMMHRKFTDRNHKVDAHFRTREREVSSGSWKEGFEARSLEIKRLQDQITILEERFRRAGLSTK